MWSHLNTQPLKMLLRKVIKPGKMTKRHINFTMVVNFIIVFKAPIFRSYFYNTLTVVLQSVISKNFGKHVLTSRNR